MADGSRRCKPKDADATENRELVASLAGGGGRRDKPDAMLAGNAEAQRSRCEPEAMPRASWRSILAKVKGWATRPGEGAAEGESRNQQISLDVTSGRQRKLGVKSDGQSKAKLRRKPEVSQRRHGKTTNLWSNL